MKELLTGEALASQGPTLHLDLQFSVPAALPHLSRAGQDRQTVPLHGDADALQRNSFPSVDNGNQNTGQSR